VNDEAGGLGPGRALRVGHLEHRSLQALEPEHAGVAHLATALRVERRPVEDDLGDRSGLGAKLDLGDRLQVGFDLIAHNPFALIPVLGLPVAIAAVLRPPAALRPSLQRSPAWRDAVLVTLLAGVVAYVVNDSGPAAAGLAFGLGLGGLLGVSLLSEAGKMGEP